ncbi:MAG: hypothetical protein MdMp014T_3014 [Treponematales bacterium]
MIYAPVGTAEPIRQGDIFFGVPRVDLSLDKMLVCDAQGEKRFDWQELVRVNNTPDVILPVTIVNAIVITQDCDAARSPNLTLCEIRNFRNVEKKSEKTNSPKGWISILTQHARINQKWFYLPPDETIGFDDKMGVDFLLTLSLRRVDLERLRCLRRGRLNDVANEHFRERLGEFFRRYAYNEWYPLDTTEFTSYQKDYPDAEPYPWQESPAP